ncbi:hypothetical protein HDE_06011 [Halotydeus destructor]|nr:hypothetical protein HDE_06011 [Halotydeus destructor]
MSTGFITPPFVGLVLETNDDIMTAWRIVFGIMLLLMFSGSILFAFYGDATIQPWNDPDTKVAVNLKTPVVMKTKRKDVTVSIRL